MNERLLYEFLQAEGFDEDEIENKLWDLAEESNERRKSYELEENYPL